MGSRATFAIVGDELELFYDHWGAQCLSQAIVLDGEEATVARVRRMRRLNPNEFGAWLDDVWGEGCLVIDYRTRQLIWFDHEGLNPRAASALIEATWTGWQSIWSPEGMRGILTLLNIEPELQIGARGEGRTWKGFQPEYLDPNKEATYTVAGTVKTSHFVDNQLILSVRFEDNTAWAVAVGTWLDGVAEIPAEKVVDYVRQARADGRSGAGPEGRWDVPTERWGDSWVDQGVHIDLGQQLVRYWCNNREVWQVDSFSRNWPGFDISCIGDNYEWQEQAASIHGIQPDPVDVLAATRDELARAAAERTDHENPSTLIAQHLAATGEEVQLSRWATAFEPARAVGRSAAFGAVKELIASPERLVPARYVDSAGRVAAPGAVEPGIDRRKSRDG